MATLPSIAPPARVRAFDWLRGIAVLVMVQTHAMSLLRPELRLPGPIFSRLVWVDGLVAPSFILAAGFSLALVQVRGAAAGTRLKRALKTLRRLGEVLFVSAFMTWIWFPIFREPKWLLRIDILSCIGLSLLLALPLMAVLAPRPRVLSWVSLGLAALAFGLAPVAEGVRGPLAHFVNTSSDSVFPLLPWGGYVYLGASAGAVAACGDLKALNRWMLGLLVVGLAVWKAAPLIVPLYPPHNYWITAPSNHAQRWAMVSLLSLLLLGLEQRVPGRWRQWTLVRFVEVFGMSSLAAYFSHEIFLYARIFGFSFHARWGDQCGWGKYAALTAALIGCTFVYTWIVGRLYPIGEEALRGILRRLKPRAQPVGKPLQRDSGS